MYLKESRLKRVKNGITCSKECTYILKAQYMKDEGNHQFGLKGEKNSSFKGIETTHHDYIWAYVPNHPKANRDGRVLQHRYVIEKNYKEFDENYFDIVNNFYILKDIYDVHHINEVKNDNSLKNLQILTKSEHTTLHNLQKSKALNKYRLIIGVLKQGELLENLEADNQQPSLDSNIFEGSTTNNRVLIKDSNVDTSALLQQILDIVGDDIV